MPRADLFRHLFYLSLVLGFALQPLMAGNHKKKPAPDRYIQNYERKLADLEKRKQDTDKMLKQANADFRKQTERKQRELKELAEEYKQREARAQKAIKEFGEQQDSISAALKKYRIGLAAKQATAAKKRQEEAKKTAAAKKPAEDAKRKIDSRKKPAPKAKVDLKKREEIRKRAEVLAGHAQLLGRWPLAVRTAHGRIAHGRRRERTDGARETERVLRRPRSADPALAPPPRRPGDHPG